MKNLNIALEEMGFKEVFNVDNIVSYNRNYVKELIDTRVSSLNYCYTRETYRIEIILQKKEALDFKPFSFIKDLNKKSIRAKFIGEKKLAGDIRIVAFELKVTVIER